MAADCWRQIETLYHATLERPSDDRAAFLASACGNDEVLRREVESLLDQPASVKAFLDEPALAVAAQMIGDADHTVLTGRRLGVYQLHTRLARGERSQFVQGDGLAAACVAT